MPDTPEKRIVVCGHICLDIIPGFPPVEARLDYFRPGRLSVVEAAMTATGGAVSNVGLGLDKLGLPVRLVAKVGSDPFGGIVIGRLSNVNPGLVTGITSADGEITSYTVVLCPPGIDRILLHCPGANDTFTDLDVPDSALEGASLFHFGYPPIMKQIWSDGGGRLSRILSRVRQRGILTSLDMSLPDPASPSGRIDWGAFLSRVLPGVDLFLPSVEEFLYMADRASFDALSARGGSEAIVRDISLEEVSRLADRAVELGTAVVLVKMGERGAYLRTGKAGLAGHPGWEGRELYSPVFHVPRIGGTTGSGDATITGFLASVFKGSGPEEALTMAVAVGACCVEAPDATSGIQPWDETSARVSRGWQRASVDVTETGWQRLASGLWAGPRDCGPEDATRYR